VIDQLPAAELRRIQYAALAGYLDALGSIDGRFRDFAFGTRLIDLRNVEIGIEGAVRADLQKPPKAIAVTDFSSADGMSAFGAFLRSALLTRPFGNPGGRSDPKVWHTIHELEFQIHQRVRDLAADYEPGAVYRMQLAHPRAESASGCVIEVDHDALVIYHVEWMRG
jgi:hypothetical protein